MNTENEKKQNVVYDDQAESGCLGVFLCILGALFAIMAIVNLFMGFDDVSKLGDLGGYGRYGGSGGDIQTKMMFQQVVLPFMQYITLSFLCFGINAVLNAIAKNKILRINVKAQAPVESRPFMSDNHNAIQHTSMPNSQAGFTSQGYFYDSDSDKQMNDRGFANDAFKQGLAYFQGINTDVDFFKAFDCFYDAAQKGHSEAQYMLGLCFHKGYGVNMNYEKAVHYLLKAANNGNDKAKLYLNKIM